MIDHSRPRISLSIWLDTTRRRFCLVPSRWHGEHALISNLPAPSPSSFAWREGKPCAPNTARRHREQKREIRGEAPGIPVTCRTTDGARFYPVSLKHCLSQFPSSRGEDSRTTSRSRASPKDVSLFLSPLLSVYLYLSISPCIFRFLRCLPAMLTLLTNPRLVLISGPIRTHDFARGIPMRTIQRERHPATLCYELKARMLVEFPIVRVLLTVKNPAPKGHYSDVARKHYRETLPNVASARRA